MDASQPPPYIPTPAGAPRSGEGLAGRYASLSDDLAQCRLAAAELYGFVEAQEVKHADEPGAGTDKKPPRAQPALPPIPSRLNEHLIRLRIWESECGLKRSLEQDKWLRALDEGIGLTRLLDDAITNLEERVKITLDYVTKGNPDINDEAWQALMVQHCNTIGVGIDKLAQTQPLIQMHRASFGQGEGPLARLKTKIDSIARIFEHGSALSIIVHEDNVGQKGATTGSGEPPLSIFADLMLLWRPEQVWSHIRQLAGPIWFRELGRLTSESLIQAALHVALLTLQLCCLVAAPFFVVSPIWVAVLLFLGTKLICDGICKRLNSNTRETARSTSRALPPHHAHETWILMAGIGVNGPLLQARLDRLSVVFGRSIEAVPSQTSGILLDFLQSVWLRSFSPVVPSTRDSRTAFSLVSKRLHDPAFSKVVLLAASSGALHASAVVDQLLSEVPRDLLGKLEIYTFGAFCKHFHNPLAHATTHSPPPGLADPRSLPHTDPIALTAGNGSRVIPHIEHYANRNDPFASRGVLAHRASVRGTVFEMVPGERTGRGRGDVLLNAGYLDKLFVFTGQGDDEAAHIAGLVFLGQDSEGRGIREAVGEGDQMMVSIWDSDATQRSGVAELKGKGRADVLSGGQSGGPQGVGGKYGRLMKYACGRAPQDGAPPSEHDESDDVQPATL